jgi:hypothetical protein
MSTPEKATDHSLLTLRVRFVIVFEESLPSPDASLVVTLSFTSFVRSSRMDTDTAVLLRFSWE